MNACVVEGPAEDGLGGVLCTGQAGGPRLRRRRAVAPRAPSRTAPSAACRRLLGQEARVPVRVAQTHPASATSGEQPCADRFGPAKQRAVRDGRRCAQRRSATACSSRRRRPIERARAVRARAAAHRPARVFEREQLYAYSRAAGARAAAGRKCARARGREAPHTVRRSEQALRASERRGGYRAEPGQVLSARQAWSGSVPARAALEPAGKAHSDGTSGRIVRPECRRGRHPRARGPCTISSPRSRLWALVGHRK